MNLSTFYFLTCLICLLRSFFIRDRYYRLHKKKSKLYIDTLLITEAMIPGWNIICLFLSSDLEEFD